MGKRPRIKKSTENIGSTQVLIADGQTNHFSQNCATPNGKLIHKYNDFEIEIWIDQHYEKRATIGDDSGLRLGIEKEKVTSLIIDCVKYIFHFYMTLRLNHVINFFDKDNPTKDRIILKDFRGSEEALNVAVEIHFLDYSKYEITIITAMKGNDFKMFDGQYNISITDEGVNLNKFQNKTLLSVDKLKL